MQRSNKQKKRNTIYLKAGCPSTSTYDTVCDTISSENRIALILATMSFFRNGAEYEQEMSVRRNENVSSTDGFANGYNNIPFATHLDKNSEEMPFSTDANEAKETMEEVEAVNTHFLFNTMCISTGSAFFFRRYQELRSPQGLKDIDETKPRILSQFSTPKSPSLKV